MGQNSQEFQKFLDTNQYSWKGVTLYEEIFGKTWVSTGGEETTERFIRDHLREDLVKVQNGARVLDIGCGSGGSAFYMARRFGAHFLGVDLSSNMIELAKVYRAKQEPAVQHRCQFRVEDATTMPYPENFYDVLYSRDTILHIEDKKSLFEDFYKTLKPGGLLFITDYCHGEPSGHTQRFKDYVKQRGYILKTVPEYGKILESAGFTEVEAIDGTDYFVEILNTELARFVPQKAMIEKEYSLADYNKIVDGWNDKLVRCADGDQKWGIFVARKPYTD